MRRIWWAAIGGLVLTMVTSHGAWAFGVKDVVAMHKDGVADSLIIQKIDYGETRFHLNGKDIGELKRAGVSDEVISRMLKTEAREYARPYLVPYWGGPYYPYYRPPYYAPYYYYTPYYPRVSVGLRFGYYGHRGAFRHWRRF